MSRATGVAPSTIECGLRELDETEPLAPGWMHRGGGGRKTLVAVAKRERVSLQANHKALEGNSHPDRHAQFGYIGASVPHALAAG